MRSSGFRKFVLLALALLASTTGCGTREGAPNLIETLAFYPNEASGGDTLHVVGQSLPEGRHATVTFRGSLFRAGRAPVRDVEIEAPALHVAKNSLDVQITDALESEFCGEAGTHTTFRGDVVAAFAARVPGAPPVTGRVPGVVLDVRPVPLSARDSRQNAAEGQRFSQFLGVDLARPTERARFQISGVVPGSRAERAGVEPGDTLLSLDGVTLEAWEIFVPSGEQHLSELTVDRPRGGHALQLVLDVEGFKSIARAELVPATFGVLLVSLTLLLSRGPLGRVLSFLERQWFAVRAAEQERTEQQRRERPAPPTLPSLRRELERLARGLVSALPENLALRALACGAVLAICLVFMGISLGVGFVDSELDLSLLFACSTVFLGSVMAASAGFEGSGAWSLRRGLGRATQVLALQLPVLAALVCAGLSAGSLRAETLLEAQGGYPWQWRAFASPVFLVLSALSVACLVPRSTLATGAIPEALGAVSLRPRKSTTRSLAQLVELMHVGVTAGVLANLMFGGWRLPGVSLSGPTQSLQLNARIGSALLLQLKLLGLVLLVVGLRRWLPKMYVAHVSRWIWSAVVPLSLGAVLACAAWTSVADLPTLRELGGLAAPLLFATCVCLAGFMGLRLFGKSKTSLLNHANPWL